MNPSTPHKSKKAEKKLSIYLSSKRLALLNAFSSQKGNTLAEGMYQLIDGLEEPRISLNSVQADIRRLENMVKHSIKSTSSLTATLTLALDGPQQEEHREFTALDTWLHSLDVGAQDTTILAIVIPTGATTDEVHFTTQSARVSARPITAHNLPLTLTREQAGPEVFLMMKNSQHPQLAMSGKRVEGTDWQFKILAQDETGKFTQLIRTFKHPS